MDLGAALRSVAVRHPRLAGGLDPSADGYTIAKLVIDATVPPGSRDRPGRMRSASAMLDT
jgi:hypothetical protein